MWTFSLQLERRVSESHFVSAAHVSHASHGSIVDAVSAVMYSAFTLKIETSLSSEQMLYYVDNVADTIKFYHNLLKNSGTLMIVIEAGI